MTSTYVEELVFDTLYHRRAQPNASCIRVNVAGQELAHHSADALPVIEQVLQSVVIPKLTQSKDHVFPGLSNLLGAYMLIGSHYDVTRSVEFLRAMPPALQAKAVALVPLFFRKSVFDPKERDGNDLKRPPAEELIAFIKDSTRSEHDVLREDAEWAISQFVQ